MIKLQQIRDSQQLKSDFTEKFLFDVMGQLNILDPDDEADEILDIIETGLENDDVQKVLKYFLGIEFLDEWLEEFEMTDE